MAAAGSGPKRLPYPVLPANGEAVKVFIRSQTQWRYTGDPPAHTGLDYVAVTAVMKSMGIRKRDRDNVLRRVQIIEGEAIRIFAKRRSDELTKVRRAAARAKAQQSSRKVGARR